MNLRLLFLFLLSLLTMSSPRLLAANTGALAELEADLALLLPGIGLQVASARTYARDRILTLVDQLEGLKVAKKKPAKAIGLLRAAVERDLLKQYEPLADFTTLFTQFTYDQATASALYTLLLNQLGMTYETHVRETAIVLILYPDTDPQELRIPRTPRLTTATTKRFQTDYLELLTSLGEIQPNAWNRTPEEVFGHYYPGNNEPLTIEQMASFLCYRQALRAYGDKSWTSALEDIELAEQLAPHRAHQLLRRAVWMQLANTESSGRESLYYLWQLWEERSQDPWETELVNRFNKSVTNLPEPSAWTIDSLYTSFHDKFAESPTTQLQLKEMYFLQRARFHAQEGKHFPVMDFMDSLYQLRPQDTEVHSVIGFMLVRTLQPVREHKEGLERISYYGGRYPFLRKNPFFLDRHLYYKAEQVHAAFALDEAERGQAYFEEFVSLLQRSGRTQGFASWVTTSYLAVSGYHFREGNYRQAQQLIEEALQSLPNDDYLLHRRELLRKY